MGMSPWTHSTQAEHLRDEPLAKQFALFNILKHDILSVKEKLW